MKCYNLVYMHKYLPVLLLTLTIFSCRKEETVSTPERFDDSENSTAIAFAKSTLSAEQFAQYTWSAMKPIVQKDKLIGWIVKGNSTDPEHKSIITIRANNGKPAGIQISKIRMGRQNHGQHVPVAIEAIDPVTKRESKYLLREEAKREGEGFREIERLSLVSGTTRSLSWTPGPGLLPPSTTSTPPPSLGAYPPSITISHIYTSVGGAVPAPDGGSTYILSGLLGISENSSGNYTDNGGYGTGGGYDPYLYFDALNPEFVADGPSAEWPVLIDFTENKVINGVWYTPQAYPYKEDGLPWLWWEESPEAYAFVAAPYIDLGQDLPDDFPPCIKEIIEKVMSVDHPIIKAIKTVFGDNLKFKLKFELDATIDPRAGKAQPIRYYTWNKDGIATSLTGLTVSVKINPIKFEQSSKLFITSTIIHELIHAYMHYRQTEAWGNSQREIDFKLDFDFMQVFNPNNVPSNNSQVQHEVMATKYVTEIGNILAQISSVSDNDLNAMRTAAVLSRKISNSFSLKNFFESLGWAGLQENTNGWNAFAASNSQLASDIIKIIQVEEYTPEESPSKQKCQ